MADNAGSGNWLDGQRFGAVASEANISSWIDSILSMSHWAFVLMGLHLGLHVPVMTAKWKMANKVKWVVSVPFCILAGIGLFLFLKNGMPDYMFFRVPFAFLDYEKAGGLVIFENILMLLFWAFIGTQAALLCRNLQRQLGGNLNEDNNPYGKSEPERLNEHSGIRIC